MLLKAKMPDGDDLVFADELFIYLMLLDVDSVLHIVGSATYFSDTTFLNSNEKTYGSLYKKYDEYLFRQGVLFSQDT